MIFFRTPFSLFPSTPSHLLHLPKKKKITSYFRNLEPPRASLFRNRARNNFRQFLGEPQYLLARRSSFPEPNVARDLLSKKMLDERE